MACFSVRTTTKSMLPGVEAGFGAGGVSVIVAR
jgi:hypothetical protein